MGIVGMEAIFGSCSDEIVKVSHRAKIRMDCIMTALGRADRPWRSGITRGCLGRVVPTFAVLVANGVNRWQIDHVETHASDIG